MPCYCSELSTLRADESKLVSILTFIRSAGQEADALGAINSSLAGYFSGEAAFVRLENPGFFSSNLNSYSSTLPSGISSLESSISQNLSSLRQEIESKQSSDNAWHEEQRRQAEAAAAAAAAATGDK